MDNVGSQSEYEGGVLCLKKKKVGAGRKFVGFIAGHRAYR